MAVGNLLGAVCLWDGENPRTFTGMAKEVISGGQFVYVSGASAASQVGSQTASFAGDELSLKICDTIGFCNGIALNNAAISGLCTVATRGTYIIKAANDISGGTIVINNGRGDAVSACGVTDVGSWIGIVGRALSYAGSEDYCLVALNLL